VEATLGQPPRRTHLGLEIGFAASLAVLAAAGVASAQSAAGDNAADLAKQLSNPIANLISVPFQNNYDWGMGPSGDGWQFKLNIQPVIPIPLNDNWNMISRTIVPVVDQDKVVDNGHQSGLGDTTQSLFFSPKVPTSGGWIWGAGPVFLLPTATDRRLGSQKWGAGPTIVVLKQESGWTYGILANQIWSFAGRSNRRNVNATYLQPFLTYATSGGTTFAVNTESSYDWVGRQWTVPVNLSVAQLFKPKSTGLPMPIQVQLGYRYYFDAPGRKPDSGVRLTLTALFPK